MSNNLPYNQDFERALLVGILTDPSLITRVQQLIGAKDFFKQSHQEIFGVISDLNIENVDSLTVEDKLTESTKGYFKDLVRDSESILPSLSNILIYAQEIRSKSILRSGINLGQNIVTMCLEQGVDASETTQKLEDLFSDFIQQRVSDNRTESTKEAFASFLNNLGRNLKADSKGVKTGFAAVDMILHRLEGLIVLAARPGMGKTAFAINVARNVGQKNPVLFFSLEQTQEQIFERMLASEAEVGLEDIRTGAFIADPDAIRRIEQVKPAMLEIMEHIHVDQQPHISSSYITSMARQKKFEWGEIGLIVVDYLHIMALNDKQKVDALGDATKELRALGKEIGCPVILLSQLSRQPETVTNDSDRKVRRRPELTDLRSSGEIEQSADVVVFLYRDSYFDQSGFAPERDAVEVIIKKHRNGRTGMVELSWFPAYVKFAD